MKKVINVPKVAGAGRYTSHRKNLPFLRLRYDELGITNYELGIEESLSVFAKATPRQAAMLFYGFFFLPLGCSYGVSKGVKFGECGKLS